MAKYAKKRKSYKKSTAKQARAVVKASKYLMLKSVETKYLSTSVDFTINNNDLVSFSPTQALGIGNTAITRVGDSILLQNFTINNSFHVNSGVLNAKIRTIVGWTRDQVANTTPAANILSSGDLFYAAGVTPMVSRIINPAVFTAIYDEVADVNSNTTTSRDLKSTYAAIKLGLKKFDYAEVGGSLGKTRNLVFCFMTWDPNTIYGTVVGKIVGSTCMKFKDP